MHHLTITGCHLMLLELFCWAAFNCWDQNSLANELSGYLATTFSEFSFMMASKSSWESLSTTTPSFDKFSTLSFNFCTFLHFSFSATLCILTFTFCFGVDRYRSFVWRWCILAAFGEAPLLRKRGLLSVFLYRLHALQHFPCWVPAGRSTSQSTCRIDAEGSSCLST